VTRYAISLLCLALVLAGVGCGGRRTATRTTRVSKPTLPPPSKSARYKYKQHPDEKILEAVIRGQPMPPAEISELSDRMLAEGSLRTEQSLARLDIVLNKSLDGAPREVRHRLLRNLGIIHYHQKKYNLARQELQQANELYPRDGRTHFYLARLAAHQGNIYQRKGLRKKAKGQYNLAANEMEIAQKLEPSNDLYRQDLKKILQDESTRASNLKK
jgi:tetratricopeptide (TPR) repeat protein